MTCVGHCKGDKCKRADGTCSVCENGFGGKSCELTCSANCAEGACGTNGKCTKGCVDGTWGKGNCNKTCVGHCKDGKCNRADGTCSVC